MIRQILTENALLWTFLWQSAAFTTMGLVAAFAFVRRPSRAHHVLLLAIVAAVVVPLATVSVRYLGLGLFAAEPVAIAAPAEPIAVNLSASPRLDITKAAPMHLESRTDRSLRSVSLVETEGVEVKPASPRADRYSAPLPTPSESRQFPWRTVLLFAWVTVSAMLALRLVLKFAMGVRLAKSAVPADWQNVREAAHLAGAEVGIGGSVRLLAHERVHSPMIWCWNSEPALLLPPVDGNHDGIDWVSIFCHELAHYKRRDHVAGLLAELAVCLLPWQILLWWARRHLLTLSERACDDWVLACGRPCADYAESLLDLAPQGQMAFIPAVLRSRSGLAARVRRVLAGRCPNPRAGLLWLVAVGLATASIGLGVALAQTRPARPVIEDKPAKPVDEAAARLQPKPDKSLYWAAQNGHGDLANRLISTGADIEAKNGYRRTPLAVAAHAGHKEMVELLLAKGATIETKDIWYKTPLFHAAANGHADLVTFLIAKGADAKVKSNLGYTPLSLAAENGHAPTVKLLLDAGADVNTVGNGRTPLGRTVSAGHIEAARLLVAAGADVNAEGSSHETPLMKAASGGHIEIARLLIAAGAEADRKALYEAIMAGNRQMAELMLENGAAVTLPALHFAAFMGDLPKVTKLVEQGADVESRDNDKQTPLVLAALGGQRQVIQFLLDNGADIAAVDSRHRTVLQKAAERGDKGMVEFLLSKGAAANAASGEGIRSITPLGCAVRYGHRDAADVLLRHGADPDAKGMCGRTPLQWAAVRGHTEVAKLLLEHGATVNAPAGNDGTRPLEWMRGRPPLHDAVSWDRSEIIKLLITHGADVNSRDRYGATALHSADPTGAAILIAHGADIGARDEKGRMPIHPAAASGEPRLVEMLIAKGADVNAKDGKGRTPLQYGAADLHSKVSEYNTDPTATMRVLIAAGADIEAKADNGATALYEAAAKGNTEAVKLLLAEGADFNVAADEEDEKGLTLLHAAAKHFRLDMIALLIAKGADVNAKTASGRTPIDLVKAATGVSGGNRRSLQRRTIKLLVEYGAEE